MRASLKFITDSYRQFNRECFAGILPEVELHVSLFPSGFGLSEVPQNPRRTRLAVC